MLRTTDEGHFSLLHDSTFSSLISSSQLLTRAALGQAVVPLSFVGNDFGTTSPAQPNWYKVGYSLTVGTFILIAGRLDDTYAHKTLFIGGYLWFRPQSLIVGATYHDSSQVFIGCRVLQGIGPTFLLLHALAILGRVCPEGRRKRLAFSIFGRTAPGGLIVGALFASISTELAVWPWEYWILA